MRFGFRISMPDLYECGYCDAKFMVEERLRMHMEQIHRPGTEHICGRCGQLHCEMVAISSMRFIIEQRTIRVSYSLKEACEQRHDDHIFKCGECCYIFASETELVKHRPCLYKYIDHFHGLWRCKHGTCSATFYTETKLRRHVTKHLKEMRSKPIESTPDEVKSQFATNSVQSESSCMNDEGVGNKNVEISRSSTSSEETKVNSIREKAIDKEVNEEVSDEDDGEDGESRWIACAPLSNSTKC